MSTSLQVLIQNVAKEMEAYASGTCSTTGSTTTIVDASADSPFDVDDEALLFANCWAKIESDSAGTPLNVGETRRIRKNGYTPSIQTVEVSAGFSNATTATQSFGIYRTLPPTTMGLQKGIKEYLNDVLPKLFRKEPVLLTLCTDGDMEASGTTSWTDSNATLSKSTSTGVRLGKQALRVQNSSANGYAQSVSVDVEEGQMWQVAADVTIASGTAELVLWDVTNDAEINSRECAETQARFLWLQEDIPDDCKQVAVRLRGVEANADVYWDNVTLRNAAALEMALPSWFVDKDWLEWLYVWRPLFGGVSGDHLAVDALRRNPVAWCDVIEDAAGYTPYKATWESYLPSGSHLFAYCVRPFTALSADADTTDADAEWVEAWALANIYARLAETNPDYQPQAKRWLDSAKARHAEKQPHVERPAYRMRGYF